MKIDLNNSIGFKINRIANQINTNFNFMLQSYNIGAEQRVALEIINNEEEVTLTKISEKLLKDKTTISRTLSALENKGYIKRVASQKDRRITFIKLTNKGEETLHSSDGDVNNFRKSLVKNLKEDEIKKLFDLLEKVNID